MKKFLLSIFTLVIPFLTFSQEAAEVGLDQKIDQAFKPFSDAVFGAIFFEILGIPFVLILLVFSALFFTIYFGFPNVRYFGKAINTVRGKYDEIEGGHHASDTSMTIDGDIRDTIRDESQEGEVSHFQALATAVSGTVGNGNIAGVALAIALGGPGATFWMIVCGLLGMSTKFVECTLGVQYRDIGEDGTVYGGPMYYITKGLKEKGFAKLGKIAAVIFAIFCIGGSFGGGNAAQSNQATVVLKELMGLESTGAGFWIGVIMAIVVGIIIIGGIIAFSLVLVLVMIVVVSLKPDNKNTQNSFSPSKAGTSNNIGRSVTAVNRGVGGGARIMGRIEDEQGNRVKVTITYISEYAVRDLAPYGYGRVFQGDSVWTPKRIWSVD